MINLERRCLLMQVQTGRQCMKSEHTLSHGSCLDWVTYAAHQKTSLQHFNTKTLHLHFHPHLEYLKAKKNKPESPLTQQTNLWSFTP